MVFIKGGTFAMGCTNEQADDCFVDEYPVHSVSVSDFYIGKYEVTQAEWREVMGGDPPELYFSNCDACPVESISWEEAIEFIAKLNKLTGNNYRLPTEAEWEYAARGGSLSRGYKYAGSNSLDEVGWNYGNSGNKTRQVGMKKANELGLHDMSGNVWEWCNDIYGPYSAGMQINPKGPEMEDPYQRRVYRGGSWFNKVQYYRNSFRISTVSWYRNNNLGFRLVL